MKNVADEIKPKKTKDSKKKKSRKMHENATLLANTQLPNSPEIIHLNRERNNEEVNAIDHFPDMTFIDRSRYESE